MNPSVSFILAAVNGFIVAIPKTKMTDFAHT
jgi:hypothetical protein